MTLRSDILALARDHFSTEAEYLFSKYPCFAVLRHPNKKWYGVIMDLPREKLGLTGGEMIDVINVKCGPALSGTLRQQPGIFPGYHMNKESWVTVLLDGTVSMEDIELLLNISYDLVGTRSSRKVKKRELE